MTDFFVPSPTVQIMPELMDRIGLLKSETIKAVTAAYPVIGQSRRELVMLVECGRASANESGARRT